MTGAEKKKDENMVVDSLSIGAIWFANVRVGPFTETTL